MSCDLEMTSPQLGHRPAPATAHTARWNRVLSGLCLIAALMGSGCGGGSDGPSASQAAASNEVQGLLLDGSGAAPAEVHVRGATGLPRTTAASADGSYHVTVRGLTPPYLVSVDLVDPNTGVPSQLFAPALVPGRINVTPLTTLLLAQLTGQEPRVVYNTIARQTGLSFSAAQLSAAEDAVATYLTAVLDVPVPAGVRNFVSGDVAAHAGDPMFDVLSALNTRLAERGEDITAVARRVALQVVRCASNRLRIDAEGRTRDFCAAGGTSDVDPVDPALTLYHFDSDENGSLDIRSNGSSVNGVTWTSPAGTAYTCQASACAGLGLGAQSGDGSRALTASALALSDGSGGSASLNGRVLAAAPGVPLPAALTCTFNRYTLRFADGRSVSNCLVTDEIGQGGSFGTRRGNSERRFYSFFAADFAQQFDLTVSGDAFAHLVLFASDPSTGERAVYACNAADCAAVAFGANKPDPLAMGYQVRLVTLAGTTLTRLGSDGVFDPADTVTLDGSLLAMTDPFVPVDIPSDCSGATELITAALTGTTRSYGVCPPAEDPSATFSQLDVDGVSQLLFARSPNFQSISVTLLGDVVTRAVFDAGSLQERFACGRTAAGEPACDAITVDAADTEGRRRLHVLGQALLEIESGDLVGTRSATLDGALFIAAPLPVQ
jgi:hypothetical protein